jgi:hypothetical protein
VQSNFNHNQGTPSANVSVHWPATTTNHNLLVAVVSWKAAGVAPVIAAPSGWLLAKSTGSAQTGCSVYYYPNAPALNDTGSFSATGVSMLTQIAVCVAEYKGMLASPLDLTPATTSGAGSHPTSPSSAGQAQAKEIFIAGFMWNTQDVISAPTNSFLVRQQGHDFSVSAGLCELRVISTTSVTCSVSPNETWGSVLATFKAT